MFVNVKCSFTQSKIAQLLTVQYWQLTTRASQLKPNTFKLLMYFTKLTLT